MGKLRIGSEEGAAVGTMARETRSTSRGPGLAPSAGALPTPLFCDVGTHVRAPFTDKEAESQ